MQRMLEVTMPLWFVWVGLGIACAIAYMLGHARGSAAAFRRQIDAPLIRDLITQIHTVRDHAIALGLRVCSLEKKDELASPDQSIEEEPITSPQTAR